MSEEISDRTYEEFLVEIPGKILLLTLDGVPKKPKQHTCHQGVSTAQVLSYTGATFM